MKKYRVIRAFSTYSKGNILEANGLLGAAQYQDLIARGFIEPFQPELVGGLTPVQVKPDPPLRQRRKPTPLAMEESCDRPS